MLHILLFILKIIGIIIAVILGILILLLCIVLFVPVRYEVKARFDGKLSTARARAEVNWLLHLVRISAQYKNQRPAWRVKIAWITVLGSHKSKSEDEQIKYENDTVNKQRAEGVREHEDVGKSKESSAEADKVSEIHTESEAGSEKIKEDTAKSGPAETDRQAAEESGTEKTDRKDNEESGTQKSDGQAAEESGTEKTDRKDNEESGTQKSDRQDNEESGFHKIKRRITESRRTDKKDRKKDRRKLTDISEKIKQKVKSLSDTIKALQEKKDKVTEALSDEVHKAAFAKVKKEALRLLKRVMPRQGEADIRFGFDDPALTGQVLVGLSILYPFIGDRMHIVPNFEEAMIKGRLQLKGHFRMITFVRVAVNLFLCKAVRQTYHDIKEFEL